MVTLIHSKLVQHNPQLRDRFNENAVIRSSRAVNGQNITILVPDPFTIGKEIYTVFAFGTMTRRILLDIENYLLNVDGSSTTKDIREPRIVISNNLTEHEMLVQCPHDSPLAGHIGLRKTYDKMKTRYFWKGMHNDCDGVDCCVLPIPLESAFERLSVDLGPFPESHSGKRYIICFIDALPKWPEAFEFSNPREVYTTLFNLFKTIGHDFSRYVRLAFVTELEDYFSFYVQDKFNDQLLDKKPDTKPTDLGKDTQNVFDGLYSTHLNMKSFVLDYTTRTKKHLTKQFYNEQFYNEQDLLLKNSLENNDIEEKRIPAEEDVYIDDNKVIEDDKSTIKDFSVVTFPVYNLFVCKQTWSVINRVNDLFLFVLLFMQSVLSVVFNFSTIMTIVKNFKLIITKTIFSCSEVYRGAIYDISKDNDYNIVETTTREDNDMQNDDDNAHCLNSSVKSLTSYEDNTLFDEIDVTSSSGASNLSNKIIECLEYYKHIIDLKNSCFHWTKKLITKRLPNWITDQHAISRDTVNTINTFDIPLRFDSEPVISMNFRFPFDPNRIIDF